jgi:hypothetical protein
MALTNAERQRRWREKRNDAYEVLQGSPAEICEAILYELGPDQARKIARAFDKRLSAMKPDCPACQGTGFQPIRYSTACGMPIGQGRVKCDCSRPGVLVELPGRCATRAKR